MCRLFCIYCTSTYGSFVNAKIAYLRKVIDTQHLTQGELEDILISVKRLQTHVLYVNGPQNLFCTSYICKVKSAICDCVHKYSRVHVSPRRVFLSASLARVQITKSPWKEM